MRTLWIMRHGLAESQFETDFNRALSPVGEQQAASVARQILNDSAPLPQRMLVSPFRRTQETAQIVHPILAIDNPFETEDLLVHYGDHRILGDFLLALPDERIMIVSHMPIVASLCQYLSPGCNIVGFQTAQVAKLNFENGIGHLETVFLAQ
ncbi:phosphohistidine phosphatase SixA [Aliikangiella marina]|uniref:Phosphohistidine phosphatase SixA n=1 Tax=Aliikangiella marina TaxID=1712262 RepID=A0A545TH51_9GAMM|nr:phosphohistidine phosphatase SixA [Aliikangiella marina]TQV76557.1 phosphohistidine phosphatase SixA [Aliikangiella marina]